MLCSHIIDWCSFSQLLSFYFFVTSAILIAISTNCSPDVINANVTAKYISTVHINFFACVRLKVTLILLWGQDYLFQNIIRKLSAGVKVPGHNFFCLVIQIVLLCRKYLLCRKGRKVTVPWKIYWTNALRRRKPQKFPTLGKKLLIEQFAPHNCQLVASQFSSR